MHATLATPPRAISCTRRKARARSATLHPSRRRDLHLVQSDSAEHRPSAARRPAHISKRTSPLSVRGGGRGGRDRRATAPARRRSRDRRAAYRHPVGGPLAAICAGLGYLGWSARDRPWARVVASARGVTLVYLPSLPSSRWSTPRSAAVSRPRAPTWGQVARSMLWSALGDIRFVAGLRLRIALLRQAGLVWMAIATAKVFLIALSGFDVAYRIISPIALGPAALFSAALQQRFQPEPTTRT